MIDGMKREIVPVPINRLPDRRSAIRLATASNRRANDPAANWWMITFSDLTVLLLGFAVLWYATVTPSMEPAPAQIARPAEPKPSPCRCRRQRSAKLGKLYKTI
jgi:hypothetical protein